MREIGSLLLAILRLAGVSPDGVTLPKLRQQAVDVFTEAELRRIGRTVLAAPSEMGLGVLLSAYTGLRLGEVCGLKWQDVDTDLGLLRIRQTVERVTQSDGTSALTVQTPKTDCSRRWVPIPKEMTRLLRSQRRLPESYLLTGSDAIPDPRTCQYRYKALLRCCGVRYRGFHCLRHPYVKHTTKIFSLRLKSFQAQPVPDALQKTRRAFLHLCENTIFLTPKKRPCGLCRCAGASGVWLP